VDEPVIAKYKPYYCELKKGNSYLWCSCGRSLTQPLCDGSHKGTGFTPVKYVAGQDGEEVLFCGCKHSANQPFCDGTHNNLSDTYELASDEEIAAALSTQLIPRTANSITRLDGRCYVSNPSNFPHTTVDSLSWCVLISAELGAHHQTQHFFRQTKGTSPIASFGNSECAFLVTSGSGEIEIGHRSFSLSEHCGFYVGSNEAFRLTNNSDDPLELHVTTCPQGDDLQILDKMPKIVALDAAQRIVALDESDAQSMGDRFFQILVGKNINSSLLTEFIGDIPLSKAAMHRHLYEETLVILQGEGTMWTQNKKTHVKAGDNIFLPSKQIHSLECTSPQGIRLAGVIYPGDNPSINY